MRTREKEKSLSVLIGEADKVFSEFIRLRDTRKGFGNCFICKAPIRFTGSQNMHFIDRDQMPTRYDEINCNAGCEECNCYDENHKQRYENEMLLRYGAAVVNAIILKSKGLQKFMRYEVEELITHYKSKIYELKKA